MTGIMGESESKQKEIFRFHFRFHFHVIGPMVAPSVTSVFP